MIKKIIKKDYVIEIEDDGGLDDAVIHNIVDTAIKLTDAEEKKAKVTLVHKNGEPVKKGDQVVDFRGGKAIVESWEEPRTEGKSGRVYVVEELENGQKLKSGYYPEVYGLKWKGLPWQKEENVGDVFVEDIPFQAPEENVEVTFNQKLPKGKNALTSGMIEEAFKQRDLDESKTFNAYIETALQSLKEDVENAADLVSGEMESTRSTVLEEYVKIERLLKKAGMKEKAAEFGKLIDELSDKLKLNYFKKPKFKKEKMKSRAQELRAKHRWDSTIVKTVKPVFLCTLTNLRASYNDAKNGKLPEVFEANLMKVGKDMEADYNRINHGRDHYLEDPRIVKTLPEIVELYEKATEWAKELGYDEIGERFAFMLDTIKKGWGLD